MSSRGRLTEPVTSKQVDFILALLNESPNRRYKREIFRVISDWRYKDKPNPGRRNFYALTKGQAAFIIGALKGDIKPVADPEYATPGIENEAQRQEVLAAAREIIENKIAAYKNFPIPIDEE